MNQISDYKSLIYRTKTALISPKISRCYSVLKHNESLSPDELAELNWQKRLRLLKFAYEEVPYYRAKFDSIGLVPQDIRTREQWEVVPTLKKCDLVKHFNDLLVKCANPRWLQRSSTGGSTGEPVVVYHDKRFAMEALGWRMFSWWGVGPGENAAFAWRDFGWSRLEDIRRQILLWPTQRIYLDASLMTEASIVSFIRQCQLTRPVVIQGYVGAIECVADFILKTSIPFPTPRAVWVTAAPVSKTQRNKMQSAFCAPVYDQYGCGEVYWLGAQCMASDDLHVFSDARYIEFLDDNGDAAKIGQYGQIAVTDLENYVFPLIRYVNGDCGSAVPGLCACGVKLPLMTAVKGRVTDSLHLPDGGIIAGDYLTTLFDDDPACVKAFQVFQRNDFSIDLRVILNLAEQCSEERVSHVMTKLRGKTNGLIPIRAVYVTNIDADRGKTRYVVSEL